MKIKVQFRTKEKDKKYSEEFELIEGILKVKDDKGNVTDLNLNNIELLWHDVVFEGVTGGYVSADKPEDD